MGVNLPATTVLDKLKCSVCNNFLSFFPISISQNLENICGRCSGSNRVASHNQIYEHIAQVLRFPCRFVEEGCPEEFFPNDIPQHENNCLFKVEVCPLKYCLWEGPQLKLSGHFQDSHKDLFVEEHVKFGLVFTNDFEIIKFIRYDKRFFALKWKLDLEKYILFCGIDEYSKEYITSKSEKCTLKIEWTEAEKKTQIINLDTKCKFSECKLNRDLDYLFRQITFTAVIDFDKIFEKELKNEEINWKMLNILKCANCKEFVLPPIPDHNEILLCHKCIKTKLSSNKPPRVNIGISNMAYLLQYPCINRKLGCTTFLKPDQMKYHQQVCSYGTDINCIFHDFYLFKNQCLWKGSAKELTPHLQNHHNPLKSGVELWLLPKRIRSVDEIVYIFKVSSSFFRLVHGYGEQGYFWIVQALDFEDVDKFIYEIEIVDVNKSGELLVLRRKCAPFLNKEEMFKVKKHWCYLLEEQLDEFLTEDENVHFKVHFYRNL